MGWWTLRLLEEVAKDSKLTLDDAIQLGDEITKKAWERLRKELRSGRSRCSS